MKKYPIYFRFWFFWATLTFLYVFITILSLSWSSDVSIFLEKSFLTLGLFVPIGLGTGLYGFGSLSGISGLFVGMLSVLLVIIPLVFADKVAKKIGVKNLFIKTIFNLIILFILTLLVDFLVWNEWVSMLLLIGEKFNFG